MTSITFILKEDRRLGIAMGRHEGLVGARIIHAWSVSEGDRISGLACGKRAAVD